MLEEFEQDVTELIVIPSRGGVFEVTVDGHQVFSKKRTGRHADYDEVLAAVRQLRV